MLLVDGECWCRSLHRPCKRHRPCCCWSCRPPSCLQASCGAGCAIIPGRLQQGRTTRLAPRRQRALRINRSSRAPAVPGELQGACIGLAGTHQERTLLGLRSTSSSAGAGTRSAQRFGEPRLPEILSAWRDTRRCKAIQKLCVQQSDCCTDAHDRTGQVQCLNNICTQPPVSTHCPHSRGPVDRQPRHATHSLLPGRYLWRCALLAGSTCPHRARSLGSPCGLFCRTPRL